MLSMAFIQNAFSCGLYSVASKVIMKDGKPCLVVNPGTKSEINLTIEYSETSKLVPYVGRSIKTKVQIDKEMDNTQGIVNRIGEIQVIPPGPLAPNLGTSFDLIEKTKCKN